jgi:hypothetical protein
MGNLKPIINYNVDKIILNKKLINNRVDLASNKGFLNKRDKEELSELIEEIMQSLFDIEDCQEDSK